MGSKTEEAARPSGGGTKATQSASSKPRCGPSGFFLVTLYLARFLPQSCLWAFQSATSNPSKYRGFQMSKKNFLGPEFFFPGAQKNTFRGPKSFFLTSGFRKL